MTNSVTGVTRLMKNLKNGQVVKLKKHYAHKYCFSEDSVFKIIIKAPLKGYYSVESIKGNRSDDGLPIKGQIYHFKESHLIMAPPTCPICKEEVIIQDSKIIKHEHNKEICYGSYTPYDDSNLHK